MIDLECAGRRAFDVAPGSQYGSPLARATREGGCADGNRSSTSLACPVDHPRVPITMVDGWAHAHGKDWQAMTRAKSLVSRLGVLMLLCAAMAIAVPVGSAHASGIQIPLGGTGS